ncbi:MAG: hypothetical protein ABIS38_07105 [Sphingomicrobium sp.]
MIFAAASAFIAAGQSFTCTPVAVWDGDGPIWCAEGPKVRLAGIAAREIDNSCRSHHPCPTTNGTVARSALVRLLGRPVGQRASGHVLVRGAALRCRSVGSGKGGRTAAWCFSASAGDISCAMVAGGYALRWNSHWNEAMCRPTRAFGSAGR